MLGRVYWRESGPGYRPADGDPQRVLARPGGWNFVAHKQIGEHCEAGELIAEIQSPSKIPHQK